MSMKFGHFSTWEDQFVFLMRRALGYHFRFDEHQSGLTCWSARILLHKPQANSHGSKPKRSAAVSDAQRGMYGIKAWKFLQQT